MVDTSLEAPEAAKTPAPSTNGVIHKPTSPDPDAQELVISSLRLQIQDLFSQVTQLNGKLVKSYDRVSDLEDDLHMASATARQASLKISQLELERTQHLSALNTGLLVEKSHVTAELTRLMEKATDEAKQRGQAESAKADIEKDLDDLSATLFAQANTMVAEARYSQAMTERKVEQSETALRGAEEMVGIMQQQMQTLQAEKEEAELKARDMQVMMGKGKWVDRRQSGGSGMLGKETRLLSSHLPYQEFLLLVAHLRSVHPSSTSPPAITTLLPMAFLARLSSEDSEPTVRLDLAPSLNWLSRRSVMAAIHTGQLTIEPMSSIALLSESSATGSGGSNIPGLNSSSNNISCALCGTPIFSNPEQGPHHHQRPPTHPATANNPNSWSTSVFKKSPVPPPRSLSRPQSQHATQPAPYPPQVYIFRIASSTPLPPPQPMNPPTRTSSPSPFLPSVGSSRATPPPQNTGISASTLPTLSLNALTQSSSASATIYPLCTSGWCLARLRTTCTLWSFVRTGIIERVWEEEVPSLLPAPPTDAAAPGAPPPVPPRRRGLWGMASKLGERAASWSGDGSKDKKPSEDKNLPVPPPMQPVSSAPTRSSSPAPPLPKRNAGRPMSTLPPPPPVHPTHEPEPDLPNPHPLPPANAVVNKRFSAHQVPLPDSRPSTPAAEAPVVIFETTEAAVDEAPEASPVAEVVKPVAVPAATGPTDPVATPIEGSPVPGSAPPPLPRRAAARATRPIPTPSRPATPGNAEGADAGAGAVPKADGSLVEEPAKDEKVEPATETDQAAKAEESSKTDDASEKAATEIEATPAPPVDAVEVPRVDSPIPIPMPVEETAKVEEKVEEKPAVNGREEKEEEKKEEEETTEVYIGDVTWEERTWKEVVRLREDMFWARIGGLRA